MTKQSATPAVNPWGLKDAAFKAGYEAHKAGESDSGSAAYSTDTEKAAFLAGHHKSSMEWHQKRMQHFESEMLEHAQREGGLCIQGQQMFRDGKSRDEAMGTVDCPHEARMVGRGWDIEQQEQKKAA